MTDTTQMNVKLPVSQKREWENYVEENEEATSLSHLIRLSVQREIDDDHHGEPVPTEGLELEADDVSVELDSVHSRLDEIERAVEDVDAKLGALEAGQLVDTEDIEKLADKVYDALPRVERPETGSVGEPRDVAQEFVADANHYMDAHDCSVPDLADRGELDFGLLPVFRRYFEASEYEMQQALGHVEEYSPRVRVVDDFQYTVVFEFE